jgi:hypothetical protein
MNILRLFFIEVIIHQEANIIWYCFSFIHEFKKYIKLIILKNDYETKKKQMNISLISSLELLILVFASLFQNIQ